MGELRAISMSQIARCPILSLSPRHYRPDGSCLCRHPELIEGTCAYCGQVKPREEWACDAPWFWPNKGWVVSCLSCGGEDDEPPE